MSKNFPGITVDAWRRHVVATACIATVLAPVSAADKTLGAVTVTATRSPIDPNLPASIETRTSEQLREQNFVNVEDALKHLPNTTLRKRYIGDRNALIGGRSFSELQAPRGLVYADGYLLSQFLGQFNAPRWSMVAPEELAQVDVLYGPFSALYPGNSIGTTVVLTTRQPQGFEASVRAQVFTQDFADAGFSGTYRGHQESVWLGDKAGAWSWSIGANRLKNKSQPMQYLTLQPSTAGGAATAVSGAAAIVDPSGKPALLAGPIGSAIEDNTQEQVKLKLGYDFSPAVHGEALYAHWRNDGRRSGASILRDTAGQPVYGGLVSIAGTRYAIPAGAYAPQNVREEHGMFGFTLKTRYKAGWNAAAIVTVYDIGTDLTRTAGSAPPAAFAGGAGTLADNGGTGWKTLDLQTTYTPGAEETHALAFGYHLNRYDLQSRSFGTGDWISGKAGARLSGFFGKTSVQALYAQDTWKMSPRWQATLGVRYEQWQASDGRREYASGALAYPERSESAWSPKASLSYRVAGDLVVRASFGKGVRFPTVSELFQGSIAGATLVNNDPNLKPEYALAREVTVEKGYVLGESQGMLRATLFEDDVRDTILSQTNTQVFPNVTNIQNIERVRTRGVELAASASDVGIRGLELSGNLTYAHAIILENRNNPATVGNTWVRVPRVRANLIGTYRPDERWMTSLALRHSGRQYNTLDNSDIKPDTYGGTSSYTVWDAKATYRIARQIEASLGVNNLTNRKYYAFHPYPGRTFFGELHASF